MIFLAKRLHISKIFVPLQRKLMLKASAHMRHRPVGVGEQIIKRLLTMAKVGILRFSFYITAWRNSQANKSCARHELRG